MIKELFSADTLATRIEEMANDLDNYVDDLNIKPLIIIVLKGSFLFGADLVRFMRNDIPIAFISASSYKGRESSGVVNIENHQVDVNDRAVIIVEDIIDTGRTLTTIKKHILNSGAKSIYITTLLDKPSRRIVELDANLIGFTIDDLFVVGYGLDYNERFRSIPYIGVYSEKE